jgi:hypothetical protein
MIAGEVAAARQPQTKWNTRKDATPLFQASERLAVMDRLLPTIAVIRSFLRPLRRAATNPDCQGTDRHCRYDSCIACAPFCNGKRTILLTVGFLLRKPVSETSIRQRARHGSTFPGWPSASSRAVKGRPPTQRVQRFARIIEVPISLKPARLSSRALQ